VPLASTSYKIYNILTFNILHISYKKRQNRSGRALRFNSSPQATYNRFAYLYHAAVGFPLQSLTQRSASTHSINSNTMTTNTLSVAIIQYSPVWNDRISNLAYLENQLETLQTMPQLILLPEMFDTGFIADTQANIQASHNITLQWMKTCAARFQTTLCGSIAVSDNNKLYNRMLLVAPSGEIQQYDKHHLFSMGNEHSIFTAGNQRKIWNTHSINILPIICYDLRFPVWSRNCNDYQLIILSANWPASRQHAWDILTQARAIENQAYVIACNITGTDGNNIQYAGGSSIINFKGDTIAQLNNENGILQATLNFNLLNDFRTKFPAWKDADTFNIQ
jgi:predicted amidohydrolase